MADDCYERLISPEIYAKLFGDRKLPKQVIKEFVDAIQAMKVAADQDQFGTPFTGRVQKYIENQKTLQKMQKSEAINDLRLSKERFKFYTQEGFKDDPVEAFQAKLTFSRKLGNDARYSAMNTAAVTAHRHLNFIYSSLMELGEAHWKAFESREMSLPIRTEVKNLANGKPFTTDNKMAQEIAQIVFASNRRFYDEHIQADVPLRDLPGFTSPLTHDTGKVRSATRDVWIKKVHGLNIDRERVYGKHAGDRAKEIETLGHIYDSITGASPVKEARADAAIEDGKGVSYTKKLTQSRTLHFLDADSEHAYDLEFGASEGNYSRAVMDSIGKKSRMLGLVKIFGSNPDKALTNDIRRVGDHLEAIGRTKEAADLRRNVEAIRYSFLAVSGATTEAGDNKLAWIGQTSRNWNVLSMLSNVGIRSLANFPTMGMQIQSMTGKNFFEAHLEGFMDFVNTAPFIGNAEARSKVMRDTGFMLKDMTEAINMATFGDGVHGVQGKLNRLMFKMNGMTYLNEGLQYATSNRLMADMGEGALKPFKEMHPQLQATFLSAGLTEADVKILRGAVVKSPDGRNQITLPGIESLAKDDPAVMARAKELKISPTRYLNDVRDRYLGLLHTGANVASTSAGARELGLVAGATRKGTFEGELRRSGMQFKSFWAQAYNILHSAKNSKPNLELLAQGVLKSEGSNKSLIASWMAMSTVFGYMGQALIDMGRGRNPKDPRAIETWLDAWAKGGAGGMYADLIAPDYSWSGAAETFLGPTIGQIAGPVAKMWGEGKKDMLDDKPGFQKTVKNQATRLLRNNMPLNQAPGLAQAYDAIQFGIIYEQLKPGSALKRKSEEQKQVREGKRLDFF